MNNDLPYPVYKIGIKNIHLRTSKAYGGKALFAQNYTVTVF